MKNENPLVTFIVPAYNCGKYIKQCIDSILGQSYKNLELIIVDDGSTDNTADVMRKYTDNDRVLCLYQENKGVSVARNKALDLAKGDYVGFVDADDYIDTDYLSYFMELIKEHMADIALTPQLYKFNANKNLIKKDEKLDARVISGEMAACDMLYYNFVISPCNKLISMELIEKYGIRFDENLRFGEGFNFSLDCFQRAKTVVVGNRKIYNYRVDNPQSVMTKFSIEMVDGSFAAQERIKKHLVEPNKDILRACKYANWHTCCDLLMAMIGCKVTKKFVKRYKKVKGIARRDALCAFGAPVPLKDKVKGILFFISPVITSRIINRTRIRKFTAQD